MMEMGGSFTGTSEGELLQVPVQDGFGEAQTQASQNLADWQLMRCQLKSHLHQWGQKDGHWTKEWRTHQRLGATRWAQ